MGRRIGAWTAIPVLAWLSATGAHAMDVGSPVFAPDSSWDARVEGRYEQYDRAFRYQMGYAHFSDGSRVPGGGETVTRDMKLALYGTRFYFPVASRSKTYLELGYFEGRGLNTKGMWEAMFVDGRGGKKVDTNGMFVGGGVDLFPARVAGLDFRVHASISYVPDMTYSEHYGDVGISYSEQWFEFSLGNFVSRTFALSRKASLAPYLGVVGSVVRGTGDQRIAQPGESENKFEYLARNYTIEEDEVLFGVVGASLFWGDQASLRVEWHVFPGDLPSPDRLQDESLSFALGYAF